MKKFGTPQIILYCVSDFAKGIFTGMIANYLLYFFQPTAASGITAVVTQGYVFLGVLTFLGLIKAVGHVFDAVTDPLVALYSDRFKSLRGRRIPFMRFAAIPYALCALLIFLPPVSGVHWVNNVWVAVFLWLYFFFYTVYMIPHNALYPEVISDPKKRVFAYSVSSFAFVTGSALCYTAPAVVSLFKNAGLAANASWQVTFAVFTVIGLALLLVSAFAVKETDYVVSKIPKGNGFKAIAATFKNRDFTILTLGELFTQISMAFFQATIMYYITMLLGLKEAQSTLIMISSIGMSLLLYPLILALSRKIGKKALMLIAAAVFTVAYVVIFFADSIPLAPLIKGIVFAVFVSFPFGVLNILPGAMMSDVIQCDTIKNGANREGIFSATRSFVSKIGQSAAIMIVPSVLIIGAEAGKSVGVLGVRLTAVIAAVFSAVSLLFLFLYRNKKIMREIAAQKQREAEEQAFADAQGEERAPEQAEGQTALSELSPQGDGCAPESTDEYAAAPEVAKLLSKAVAFATVSDKNDRSADEFVKFKEFLRIGFPALYKTAHEVDIGGALLLKIKGSKDGPSALLMAHMDVVPAPGEWKYPPFGGVIADGKVWGRGTVDTKGSLIALLSAAEEQAKCGFVPAHDVYILSTSREEIGGADGPLAREYLEKQGVELSLVLDEGGAIMADPIGGVKGDFAMIALSERASRRYLITARGKSALTDMTRFMRRAQKLKLQKPTFTPEVLAMFDCLKPYMHGVMKPIFKGFRFTSPLVKAVLPKMSEPARAMLLPTVSFSAPSDAERADVVMGELAMGMTLGLTYNADSEQCEKTLFRLAELENIRIRLLEARDCPAPEPIGSAGYALVADCVKQSFENVVPCPFILFGGTDARHFVPYARSVIRFAPLKLSAAQFGSFHKTDENIDVKALEDAVRFYKGLLERL